MRFNKLLPAFIFILIGVPGLCQLNITDAATAQALAQKLVGDGVTITNISFSGNLAMTGFFKNISGTNINIDSGVVLTTGRARTVSPNFGVDGPSSQDASTSWGLPGDADLSAAIGTPTLEACVLQFDFIPLGDSIRFNYVFSSEEYDPAFVCNYNDAFAFFISGPGISGLKNIALVPNTSIPVSIFNVNDVRNASGNPLCPNNPSYYVNNVGNAFFTHEGHTKVLTALERVQPCATYTLKLVIADVGDRFFDSGVFLQAGSLVSNAIGMTNLTQLDPITGISYLVEGCAVGAFNVRRPHKDPYPLTVNLSYGGTATNGVDVLPLPSSVIIPANDSIVRVDVYPVMDLVPEGIEDLKIYALAGCAAGLPTDSSLIQIRDYDILSLSPDTAKVCRGSSLQLVATTGYTVYQWMPDPTLSATNIRDPIATPVNHNTTYICTATVGTCNARDSVFLQLKDVEFVSKTDVKCKNGTDGQIKVSGGPEWTPPVSFSLDGINWQPDSVFNNLAAGNYWVKMKDATCTDSILVTVQQAFPDLIISNIATTPAGCTGTADGTITVTAGGGNNNYLYSSDGINFQTSNVFNVAGGVFTITIKDGNGCTVSQNVNIPFINSVLVDAGPDLTICEGTSILIPAQSNGTSFVWSPGATLDNTSILTPTANPTTTTQYFITATFGFCTKKDSITVIVRPAPIPDAGPDQDICYGKVFQLQGNGGVSYQWSPSTYFVSATNLQNPDVKATNNITYYLMVVDANNCHSLIADDVKIRVTPAVKLFAGKDTVAAPNQPIQLNAVELGTSGVTSYSWTPGSFLSNPNIASPVATLTADQRFIVTGTTPAGCVGMDDILIKVYKGPDIYVPSGFTPNNDGLNDVVGPIPVGIQQFKFFRVYNRWGQLVFSTNDPGRRWDGKVAGVMQASGTFVWMAEGVDYKGNLVSRKGVITIIQ